MMEKHLSKIYFLTKEIIMFENDSRSSLRKWIFAALLAAAGVLLSPVFSFPLGVTRAFPLQHMINIFLAVLCGTRYGISAAFTTSVIRNIIGSGSLLAFPGSMIGAFLSGYLYNRTKNCGQPSLENSRAHRSSAALSLIRWPLSLWGRQKELFSIFLSSPFPAVPGALLLLSSSKGSISFKQIR